MNAKTCPLCHTSIPEHAPGGLCPACVLRGADETTEPASGPTVEEVASAFPKLEILRLIGHGGMGYVYQARQPELDRMVALKILSPALRSDPAFEERFAREARVLGKLKHPNIVTLYEHGESGGYFYLMMEFVDGVNLRQAMSAGRFSPEQALAIVPSICDALQSAHAQGVWHRDIKPENILLDKEGRVKIADFGIARILGDPERNFTLTRTGGQLGSAAYMAPEQHEKPHSVDHRADIYSLGVVIYEMLTGELPLGRFPLPSQRAEVGKRIDEIVLRTLEKERELRQQSAAAVKTEVENVASDFSRSLAADQNGLKSGTTSKTSRFSRTAIVGACMAFVSLAIGVFGPKLSNWLIQTKGADIWVIDVGRLLLFAFAMVATIFGCLAISQIRRSDGKLHGLWLAVFDGLFLPLLLVDFLLTFFFHQLGITCEWWTQSYNERSNAALIVWSCLIWPLVDFLIIRRVWRTVNSSNSTAPPQNGSTEKPTPSSRKLILLPAYLCIAVSFAVLFTKWWNEHRREGVWTPARISNTIAEQHGDAQVRVVDVSQTGQVVVVCFTCEMFRPEHELMVQYGGPVLSYPNDLASAVKSKVTDLDCLITPRAKLAGDNIGEVLAGTNLLSGRTMFRIGFVLPDAQTAEKAVKAVQETHLGKPRGLSEDRSVLLLFSLRRDSGKDAAGKPVVEGLDASLWLRPKSKAVAAQVAAAKTLSFGPVVERVIEPTNPDRYALNLASGDFVPGRNLDLSAAGVDLFASQMTSGGLDGVLTAWDMRACYCITPTKPGDFDNLTAEQLYKALAHMANWREDLEAAPIPGMNFCNVTSGITVDGLYLFITRNDLKGVLQTFPDPRGVKIRYKLVQTTAATGSIDDVSANDNAAHQSPAETSRTAAMETPARVQVVALHRRRPPEVVNLLIFLGMSAAGGWWIRLGSKTGEGTGRLSLAASLLGVAGGWLFAGFGFFLFAEVGAFVTGILSRSTKFGRAGMIASIVLLALSLLALA